MNPVFGDTAYYLTLLNADDELNRAAVLVTQQLRRPVITTEWILTELADALSRPVHRATAVQFIRDLQDDADVTILPASQELFEEGLFLYSQRHDKEWSLTDFAFRLW